MLNQSLFRSNNSINICIQIISTVNKWQKEGIVHGDIKSHNLYIDQDLNIKFFDPAGFHDLTPDQQQIALELDRKATQDLIRLIDPEYSVNTISWNTEADAPPTIIEERISVIPLTLPITQLAEQTARQYLPSWLTSYQSPAPTIDTTYQTLFADLSNLSTSLTTPYKNTIPLLTISLNQIKDNAQELQGLISTLTSDTPPAQLLGILIEIQNLSTSALTDVDHVTEIFSTQNNQDQLESILTSLKDNLTRLHELAPALDNEIQPTPVSNIRDILPEELVAYNALPQQIETKLRSRLDSIRTPVSERSLNNFHYLDDASDDQIIDTIKQIILDNPPTKTLTLNGQVIYLTKQYSTSAYGYNEYIFYTTDSDGQLIARLAHQSHSGGSFRIVPYVGGGKSRGEINKGVGFHYTQEGKLHPLLNTHLLDLQKQNASNGTINNSDILFNKEIQEILDWLTYEDEVSLYDDHELLKSFQQHPVPGSYTTDNIQTLPKPLNELFANRKYPDNFIPDFAQPPITIEYSQHPHLGNITLESFSALLNHQPITWVMAYDEAGRVWIEKIYLTNTPTTTYGNFSQIIDSGLLTNKPLEYSGQTTGLIPDIEIDKTTSFSGYYDITPLIDNLLPVQQFRKKRSIYRISPSSSELTSLTRPEF